MPFLHNELPVLHGTYFDSIARCLSIAKSRVPFGTVTCLVGWQSRTSGEDLSQRPQSLLNNGDVCPWLGHSTMSNSEFHSLGKARRQLSSSGLTPKAGRVSAWHHGVQGSAVDLGLAAALISRYRSHHALSPPRAMRRRPENGDARATRRPSVHSVRRS